VIFTLRLYPTSAPDKRSPSSQWIRKKKKGREREEGDLSRETTQDFQTDVGKMM